jgi:hypothetical protein
MFLSGNLSISHGGGDALMSQMLLQKSQSISGAVMFYGIDGKGIPEPVGADVMHLSCLRIFKMGQSRSGGTLSDYLPGAVAVDAKEKLPALGGYRAAAVNIAPEHLQGISIQGERPLAAVLLFLSNWLRHPGAAARAEAGRPAQPGAAARAGELQSGFKVLNGYRAFVKINIACGDAQGFRNAAAEAEQKPDKEPVPQVFTCFFQLFYFLRFQIDL